MALFSRSHSDKVALFFGVLFAFFAWGSVRIVQNNPLTGDNILVAVAVGGLLGLGLPRAATYGLTLSDPAEDKIAARLSSVYQMLWFGSWMALIQLTNENWLTPFIVALVSGVFFGLMMHLVSQGRRNGPKNEKAWQWAWVDRDAPLTLSGDTGRSARWFPLITFTVGLTAGLLAHNALITIGIWAVSLLLTPPLYRFKETGVWRTVKNVAVVLCLLTILYGLAATLF